MKCEYCDNELPQGALRCPSCGAVARSPNAVAVSSPEVPPAVPAGYAKAPVMRSAAERKSHVAYILLGLFLGGLGIHNFYAGRYNRALGQLLTTLLTGWLIFPLLAVGIWVLVDVCAITTDGDGVKFV